MPIINFPIIIFNVSIENFIASSNSFNKNGEIEQKISHNNESVKTRSYRNGKVTKAEKENVKCCLYLIFM